jgi:hypothetical protein
MQKPPGNVIIFVPGYMGSNLKDAHTGETVWLDLRPQNLISGNILKMLDRLRKIAPVIPRSARNLRKMNALSVI